MSETNLNNEVYKLTSARYKIEKLETLEEFIDAINEGLHDTNLLLDNKLKKSKNEYYSTIYNQLNSALSVLIQNTTKASKLSAFAIENYKSLAYEVEELKGLLSEEKDSLKEANELYKKAVEEYKKARGVMSEKEMKLALINSESGERKKVLLTLFGKDEEKKKKLIEFIKGL